jgi:hypothetical protein
MIHIESIKELILEKDNLPYPGRIYIKAGKKNDLKSTDFWVISSKEAKDQDTVDTDFGMVPESMIQYGVQSFLDVGTFQDIIDNKLEHNADLGLEDTEKLIDAIFYYLENDDFQD